jgi:hypothetical protein
LLSFFLKSAGFQSDIKLFWSSKGLRLRVGHPRITALSQGNATVLGASFSALRPNAAQQFATHYVLSYQSLKSVNNTGQLLFVSPRGLRKQTNLALVVELLR